MAMVLDEKPSANESKTDDSLTKVELPRDDSQKDSRRRVLIAVDESNTSLSALTWALDNIVKTDSDKVHVIHVQPVTQLYASPLGAGFYVSNDFMEMEQKYNQQRSREILRKAIDICKPKNVKYEADVIVGEPREAICAAVDQIKAALLVVATRGNGPVKRALLGSVSEYCIHHASCPVVVVRGSGE